MANTCGGVKSELFSPWIIRTYCDLMLNAGYRLEAEEAFRGGDCPDVQIDFLISLFVKAA